MENNCRLKLGAMLLVLTMAAGCVPMILMGVGGAAGIGTYKWMEGAMEKDYPRPMQETFNAALEAAPKVPFKVTAQNYTPSESRIDGLTQDGTAVKVLLTARPNEITTVKVRFGMMGNADWSAYYHRRIMDIMRIPDQP